MKIVIDIQVIINDYFKHGIVTLKKKKTLFIIFVNFLKTIFFWVTISKA